MGISTGLSGFHNILTAEHSKELRKEVGEALQGSSGYGLEGENDSVENLAWEFSSKNCINSRVKFPLKGGSEVEQLRLTPDSRGFSECGRRQSHSVLKQHHLKRTTEVDPEHKSIPKQYQ